MCVCVVVVVVLEKRRGRYQAFKQLGQDVASRRSWEKMWQAEATAAAITKVLRIRGVAQLARSHHCPAIT